MALTQEEFDNLPLAAARSRVSGLRAIHIHHGLCGNPVSVVDEEGHYRLAKRQWEVATLAATAAESYYGPLEGTMKDLLQRIADSSPEPSSEDFPCEAHDVPEHMTETRFDNIVNTELNEINTEPRALETLAQRLATEALQELQKLTAIAIRAQFEARRREIMNHALDALD